MGSNPYQSPNSTSPTSLSLPKHRLLVGVLLGGLLNGLVTILTWLMFYSFEGTVIREEIYLAGSLHVCMVMGVAGAFTGGMLVIFCERRVVLCLLLQCAAGFTAALFCASTGLSWRYCLMSSVVIQFLMIPICWLLLE